MRRRVFASSCLLALTLASAAPAAAATASLVADLATGPNLPFHLDESLFTLAGKALFLADGEVLWTSDGTTAGTEPFFDVCAEEACQNSAMALGVAGRSLFITAGDRLWATDGTRAGTVSLAPPGIRRDSFTLTSKHLFFHACSSEECALWKSDGTVAGTVRVGKTDLDYLFPVGDSVFWVHAKLGSGPEIDELWHAEGSDTAGAAGPPVLLRSFRAPDLNAIFSTLAAGSRFFFIASEDAAHGYELWTSDGTVAGTRPLTDLPALFPFPSEPLLEAVGDKAVFVADDTVHGAELWQSDGTPAGTRPITAFASLNPFSTTVGEHAVAQAGGRTLFVANDGLTGPRLWTSGGTPETTAALTGCPGGCPAGLGGSNLWQVGGRVYFLGRDAAHGIELWSTDGTGAGTVRVGDLCPGSCSITVLNVYAVSGTAYFEARVGRERTLWRSDGTPNGTRRLTVLIDDLVFHPFQQPVAVGGRVLFFSNGQLWATDGTPGGTAQVTALGYDGSFSVPIFLTPRGNGLFFATSYPVNGQLFATGGDAASTVPLPVAVGSEPPVVLGDRAFLLTGNALWATDGTAAGTAALGAADPQVLILFQGRLLFTRGGDFWASDGTAAGTVRLFSLPAGIGNPRFARALGDRVYFVAGTQNGESVWASDGTTAGTVQLTSVPFFFADHDPGFLRAGGTVYFLASANLWRSDGTPAGTRQVPGAAPLDLAELGGALVFFSGSSNGMGLYRSDGTAAGTVLLRALAPASLKAGPRFTAWGGRLYFAAGDSEHGSELWATDGTAAGTVLVADVSPGPRSSHPSSLVAAGSQLYFSADDGLHGAELWQSDGTAAGTRMVQDLSPGVLSSRPQELTVASDRLYFSADDEIWGRELWVYPLAAGPSCVPSATALCLGGGRFRVEASWRTADGFGMGQAVPLSGDTGYFWFFSPGNVEVIVKALDGRALNGRFWTFYGALSNVLYTLTVTDTATGAVRRYVNPAGNLASVADTAAFLPDGSGPRLSLGPAGERSPLAVRTEAAATVPKAAKAAACAPAPGRLCLASGRFAVTAAWRDFQGKTGTGTAVALTSDTGYFWFFDPGNVETVLKVLDGRAVNGRFWVFYGALSNVSYTLTVTDTATGIVKTYTNPLGRLASVADVDAF